MAQQKTINEVNGLDLEVLHTTLDNIKQDPELAKCRFHVNNKWIGGSRNRTEISSFYGAKKENQHKESFYLEADEPPILAGQDQAANPTEHLLGSLAGCMTTSMVAHAALHGIHIEEVESRVEGDIDLRGFLGLSLDTPKGFTNIRVKIKVKTDTENLKKLQELAQNSPTFNTLMDGVKVDFHIEPK
jgi:uncharacterized OsmC-like protein